MVYNTDCRFCYRYAPAIFWILFELIFQIIQIQNGVRMTFSIVVSILIID